VTNEILQEHHYYPFGMAMEGDWVNNPVKVNRYRYNGKELEEDFGLNWYAYGARYYDPAIGRFTGVDPIADQFAWVSEYNYAENEPVANIDLHGLQSVHYLGIEELKSRAEGIKTAIEQKINNAKEAIKDAGSRIYDKVIGNDDVGNSITATELATEHKESKIGNQLNRGAKVLGPALDLAEFGKILTEADMEDEVSMESSVQNAAKLGTEIGIGIIAPAASIPANILINNSRNGDVVTSPENIDRAAGAFESSRNQTKEGLKIFLELNVQKENEDENP